jgi:hypothetical protein
LQKIGDEEKQFLSALHDRKIKDAPVEQLKEVLRLVMVKVGLRANNWPNEEEKAVLLAHILTNYGGHTTKEILLAFDMAILGKLDAEVNHYENFSCKYFSEIVNAYRQWAKEAHRQNVKEQPKELEMKEDLSDQSMQDWFDDTVKQVKQKTVAVEFIPPMVCEWAAKKGLLKNPADYYAQAARKIGSDLFNNALDRESIREYTKFKEMFNSGEFSGEWVGKIERLSKQLALMEYAEKK